MKKALLAALLSMAVGSAFAQVAVGGIAGSHSGAASFAATGVVGNGASIQGTTNATSGHADVVSVAGTTGTNPVAGAAGVTTHATTTSVGLSAGATTGSGVGLTGGAAGSNAGSTGFGAFLHF
jgi:hypothetical protein